MFSEEKCVIFSKISYLKLYFVYCMKSIFIVQSEAKSAIGNKIFKIIIIVKFPEISFLRNGDTS